MNNDKNATRKLQTKTYKYNNNKKTVKKKEISTPTIHENKSNNNKTEIVLLLLDCERRINATKHERKNTKQTKRQNKKSISIQQTTQTLRQKKR